MARRSKKRGFPTLNRRNFMQLSGGCATLSSTSLLSTLVNLKLTNTAMANGGDLKEGLANALALGDGILVEPYVLGREITVGVLDLAGQPAQPFPVIEIRTASSTRIAPDVFSTKARSGLSAQR